MNNISRKDFLQTATLTTGAMLAGCATSRPPANPDEDFLDVGQRETDLVQPEVYHAYLKDGDTRDLVSLEKLERGFAKAFEEIKTVEVKDVPAVWMIYNMGVVVKTRESLFSIDLVHRRALDLAPMLDFALITHNHGDHYQTEFYRAMNGAKKTVINNFIDNYGAADWKKGGAKWFENGGFTRATKVFKIRDVEIRTTLTDHNNYLVDYTTAFEIKVGDWKMFHSGDCANVKKLNPIWGTPDLWVAFPGCGINIAEGARKIKPKLMAFGHLWELGHRVGRLTTPMVRTALEKVAAENVKTTVPMYGERIV